MSQYSWKLPRGHQKKLWMHIVQHKGMHNFTEKYSRYDHAKQSNLKYNNCETSHACHNNVKMTQFTWKNIFACFNSYVCLRTCWALQQADKKICNYLISAPQELNEANVV